MTSLSWRIYEIDTLVLHFTRYPACLVYVRNGPRTELPLKEPGQAKGAHVGMEPNQTGTTPRHANTIPTSCAVLLTEPRLSYYKAHAGFRKVIWGNFGNGVTSGILSSDDYNSAYCQPSSDIQGPSTFKVWRISHSCYERFRCLFAERGRATTLT